jgi:hypothetical protein
MHGPAPHNPLHAAARQMQDAAREAKSPWLEKVAVWAIIGSAVTTAATALLHTLHMVRRDWKEDRRDKERDRPAAAASPPDRQGHDDNTTQGMGDERRWTRREERAGAAHARGR